MFTTVMAAISYADIAFFVLLGLGLLIGILGGLARAMKGIFFALAVMLVSLLLVGATATTFAKTTVLKGLNEKLVGAISSWGDIFDEPIYIDGNGTYVVYLNEGGATNKVALEDACGSGILDQSKGKIALWLAQRFIKPDSQGKSLSQAGADMFTIIIVAAALFIIYCIALGLLGWILRMIFRRLHESESRAVRIIDRVLGAFVSTGLACIFALVVLAILRTIGSLVPVMNDYLLSSPVCGYLYLHNPIGDVLTKMFGL